MCRYSINWGQILRNTFTGVTLNNYKLIQFQYKLLLRIVTCKYKRFKMNIVKDNGRCSLCNGALETLEHIFLYCTNTKIFIRSLNNFIGHEICREYRDINHNYRVTCYHSNPLINYLNVTTKWYISKEIKIKTAFSWDEYIRFVKFALMGNREV